MQNRLWLFLLLGLFLASSCEEELGPEGPELDVYSITAVTVPQLLNIGSPRFYTVAYRVTHPDGQSAIADVTLSLLDSDETTVLQSVQLFDDGGNTDPSAEDVVADDGVYTNRIFSDPQVISEGNVFLVASVTAAGEQLSTPQAAAVAVLNSAPVISNPVFPDTLKSGSSAQLSLVVQDADELSNISSVEARLQNQNGSTLRTLELQLVPGGSATEGTYSATMDSAFAAERQGDFQLEYQATDLAGDVSNSFSSAIFLENLAPDLSNIQLADTVQLPATGSDTLVVRVMANDPQGLGDLGAVTFTVLRQGTPNPSDPIELFDNGDFAANRDEVAGDGIYSRGLVLLSSNPPGTFTFTFETADKVGNLSTSIADTIVIEQ